MPALKQTLYMAHIETPLGLMAAIGSTEALCLLEFMDYRHLEQVIMRLQRHMQSEIIPGTSPSLLSIEAELDAYFNGKLKVFKTPLQPLGSNFQKQVWNMLQKIPYGHTASYRDVAVKLGHPLAYRAVANANGRNQIAIVIPCHRVISADGSLGGYSSGLSRKQWLLDHEKRYKD